MEDKLAFRVIYADPPWSFNDHLPGKGRGASKHYHCLALDDIINYSLPPIAEDAWLFLWRVHTHQEEARYVMRAWGFNYCSEVIWKKLTKTGKRHFGMGRVLRQEHEICIIGRRGKPQPASHSVRSIIEASVRRHSEKPEEMYELIEQLTGGGPYCELFARTHRSGWMMIGDELIQV